MKEPFQEHMKNRASMVDNCEKVTIGHDFAVFKFETKGDLERGEKFMIQCNNLYKYGFSSNLADKIVCFNV